MGKLIIETKHYRDNMEELLRNYCTKHEYDYDSIHADIVNIVDPNNMLIPIDYYRNMYLKVKELINE